MALADWLLGTAVDDATNETNRVADARFVDGQPAHETTASIGMAVLTGNDDVDEIINRADRALRQAKASGKNQVVVMGPYPVQDDEEDGPTGRLVAES